MRQNLYLNITIVLIIYTFFPSKVIANEKDVAFYYLKDKKGDISIDDLIENENTHAFALKEIKGDQLNAGFTDSRFWIHFKLHNPSTQIESYILGINYPLLNEIRFYETTPQGINKKIITGETRRFHSRPIDNRNFIFDITLDPNESKSFYINIYNHGETTRLPLKLEKKDIFFQQDQLDLANKTLYYGFLVFAFIFNLFLFLSIKDRMYLFFSIYIAFLSLFLANIDGISYQFFWPENPIWANKSTILFVSIANFFLILFSSHYLRISALLPKMKYVINGILILAAITIPGLFTPYPFYRYFVIHINVLSLLNTFIILFIASLALRKNYQPAKLFIISFLLLLIGVSFYIFRNTGILPSNNLTRHGVKLGFAIQVLFLSFAVTERFRQILKNANERLESMVRERTREIEDQKNEIEAQRDELEEQKNFVARQRDQIARQNDEITDSIVYAKRIQTAVLPQEKTLRDIFNDHFILFQPRNIVSGDFYWVNPSGREIVIAAADCTGHGVPGAFMSMLGVAFLNEIVNSFSKTELTKGIDPGNILNRLTSYVKETLSKNNPREEIKDGLDIALVVYNPHTKTLKYAGAHNPLYLFKNNELIITKGDNLTVGANPHKKTVKFRTSEFKSNIGDSFYIFSDGYIDQIGGPEQKTFRSKQFKELLQSIQHQNMTEQKKTLSARFKAWKGKTEQIDDILVMGIKI